LQNVVSETDHGPLSLHLLQTSQEKLRQAARLFDLSKHRLHYRFAPGVDGRSHLGLQFPAHAVHPRRSLGKRPPWARLLSVAMKPSIFFFSRYFRLASEQYPLSVMTSCGFCPACSSIAFTVGASCCLSLVAWVTLCPTIHWKSGSTAICVL